MHPVGQHPRQRCLPLPAHPFPMIPHNVVITLGNVLVVGARTSARNRLDKRVFTVAELTLVYAVAYASQFGLLSYSTGTLSIVLTLTAAWFFGARIGLEAGMVILPLNSVMVVVTPGADWTEFISRGDPLGTAATVLVGFGIGRLCDLEARVRGAEKARMEEAAVEARAETLHRSRERVIVVA